MSRRFQFVSDLHLDLLRLSTPKQWSTIISPQAPQLVLAGDIAQLSWIHYKAFLEYCSENWKKTFLVLGNHEFYDVGFFRGKKIAATWEKELKNVHIMDNRHYVLEDDNDDEKDKNPLHIFGCTLWSEIPPHAQSDCGRMLSDFHTIHDMTLHQYNFFHDQDKKWLQNELKQLTTSSPILIVTHHAPLMNGVSDPKYETPDRTMNHAFCSDLDFLFPLIPKKSHWIFGHTHYRTSFTYRDVTVSTNALGYKGELKEEYVPQIFIL